MLGYLKRYTNYMILLLHVVIALAGLMASGWAFWRPSKGGIITSYSLLILTMASGTYLVLDRHAGLVGACFSGLTYLAITLTATLVGQRKLAARSLLS